MIDTTTHTAVSLGAAAFEWLTARRDHAATRRDVASTLRLDDVLEELGMHADDRRTCWRCQSWADHAHDQLTGARITAQPAARASVAGDAS